MNKAPEPEAPGLPEDLAVLRLARTLAATGSLQVHLRTASALLRGEDPRSKWAECSLGQFRQAVAVNLTRAAGIDATSFTEIPIAAVASAPLSTPERVEKCE